MHCVETGETTVYRRMAQRCVVEDVESSEEYDFIERPSQDFFCPVSLELLLDPQLTSCCGHHLSLDAAHKLLRSRWDRKPCPLCKSKSWDTVQDKYHQRKVNEVKVRCWYRDRGCPWNGAVKDISEHAERCKRLRWRCGYCGDIFTYEEGGKKHLPECPKFPTPCPNGCEVGSVKRCAMEEHLKVCPLERVTCEMKEFGCEVVVLRKDLPDHMRESGIQHMISMTALNLRLTKQLQKESAERDQQMERLRSDVKEEIQEMNRKLSSEIAKMPRVTEREISDLTEAVGSLETEFSEKIEEQQDLIEEQQGLIYSLQGSIDVVSAKLPSKPTQVSQSTQTTSAEIPVRQPSPVDSISSDRNRWTGTEYFTFGNYSGSKGSQSVRLSPPFYTHNQGYRLQLRISYYSSPHNDIGARIQMMEGDYDEDLRWPVSIRVRLEILNQLKDNRHVVKAKTIRWEKADVIQSIDTSMIKYTTLERKSPAKKFMVNNSLKFKLVVNVL